MTEQERNLLAEVKRVNQSRRCGYTISGGGSKGSNFQRIAIEKRMAKLEAASLVELGAHKGWWAVEQNATGTATSEQASEHLDDATNYMPQRVEK